MSESHTTCWFCVRAVIEINSIDVTVKVLTLTLFKKLFNISVELVVRLSTENSCTLFLIFTSFLTVFLSLFNVLQALSDEAMDDDPEADISQVSSPASLPAISLLSPKAMETAGLIIKFEEGKREKAKVRYDC